MSNLKSNANRLKKLVPKKPLFGLTGIENDDGSYTVRGDTEGYVWVRIEPSGAPKEVLNLITGADRLHGLRVKMEYNDDGELEIVRVVRQTNDYVSAAVAAHYNIPSAVSDLRQDVLPDKLLKGLRVRLSASGGMNVVIEPGIIEYFSGGVLVRKYYYGEELDLTADIPGVSGEKAAAVIHIDPTSSPPAASVTTGTAISSAYPAFVVQDYLDVSVTGIAVAGVTLTNGQTSISSQDNIVDLRPQISDISASADAFVVTAPDSATRNNITPTGDYPALRTRRYSSGQTSNIHEWTTEASTVLARIDKSGNALVNRLEFPAASTLTIASGAITCTAGYHKVDTEGGAGTDDLDTINGVGEGVLVCLRAANTARTVVVKNGTNIKTNTGADITLDDDEKWVMFIGKGGGVVLALSGGGGAASADVDAAVYLAWT